MSTVLTPETGAGQHASCGGPFWRTDVTGRGAKSGEGDPGSRLPSRANAGESPACKPPSAKLRRASEKGGEGRALRGNGGRNGQRPSTGCHPGQMGCAVALRALCASLCRQRRRGEGRCTCGQDLWVHRGPAPHSSSRCGAQTFHRTATHRGFCSQPPPSTINAAVHTTRSPCGIGTPAETTAASDFL